MLYVLHTRVIIYFLKCQNGKLVHIFSTYLRSLFSEIGKSLFLFQLLNLCTFSQYVYESCIRSAGNIVYVMSAKLFWSLWDKFLYYFSRGTPKKFNICLWLKSRETSMKRKWQAQKVGGVVEVFGVWLYPQSVFTPLHLSLVSNNFIQKAALLWLPSRHEFTDWEMLGAFILPFYFNFFPCTAFRRKFLRSRLASGRIGNII